MSENYKTNSLASKLLQKPERSVVCVHTHLSRLCSHTSQSSVFTHISVAPNGVNYILLNLDVTLLAEMQNLKESHKLNFTFWNALP